MLKFEQDFSGAIKKTAALKKLPQALRKQLTKWAAETVRALKASAAGMQRSGKGRKTGQLSRSIGMDIGGGRDEYRVVIGTGVNKGVTSKYAKIQDEGGTTHPTVTPRLRRWAWAMFAETGDDKYKAIALTKKPNLNVKIPASHWFSGPIKERIQRIHSYISEEAVLRQAERMAGMGGE